MENEDKLLTITEASEYLKVSIMQVRRFMERPENPLPFFYISDRSPRIKLSELQAWIKKMQEVNNGKN